MRSTGVAAVGSLAGWLFGTRPAVMGFMAVLALGGGVLIAPAVAQNSLARAVGHKPPFNCAGPDGDCEQLSNLLVAYEAAYNKKDVAAITALYAEDAIVLGEAPLARGPSEIEQYYRAIFAARFSGRVDHLDQAHVNGDMAWWDGSWSATAPGPDHADKPYHGYWGEVLVREGGAWKIRMSVNNSIETPPP